MRRRSLIITTRRFAAIALLSLVALLSVAPPALSEIDVARIEAMRDQAAGGDLTDADASAGVAAADDSAAAQAPVEETPLPPNETLPLGAGQGDLFNASAGQPAEGSLNDGWMLSTLAALGVVLAIVFGLRWLLKRGGVVSTATPQGGIVEVLSRTTVAPRSHVILMRVGTRILVVSDSTAGMRTLASVQDAEEVAELLGAIDSVKPASMTQNFGSVMKKLSGQWGADDADAELEDSAAVTIPSSSAVDEAAGALSRVRGRLASLSDAGGRA